MNEEVYRHRRFKGFLLTSFLLTFALFWAEASIYPVYAATMGTIFGVFATGLSYTDGKALEK